MIDIELRHAAEGKRVFMASVTVVVHIGVPGMYLIGGHFAEYGQPELSGIVMT